MFCEYLPPDVAVTIPDCQDILPAGYRPAPLPSPMPPTPPQEKIRINQPCIAPYDQLIFTWPLLSDLNNEDRYTKASDVYNYMRQQPGYWWGDDPKQHPDLMAAWMVGREIGVPPSRVIPDPVRYCMEAFHFSWLLQMKYASSTKDYFISWASSATSFYTSGSDVKFGTFSWGDFETLTNPPAPILVDLAREYDWTLGPTVDPDAYYNAGHYHLLQLAPYLNTVTGKMAKTAATYTWGTVDYKRGQIPADRWSLYENPYGQDGKPKDSCYWSVFYDVPGQGLAFWGNQEQFDYAIKGQTVPSCCTAKP